MTTDLVGLVDALFEVSALELGRRARDGRTAGLVRVVKTVVVPVTDPGLRNAVTRTRAGELWSTRNGSNADSNFIFSSFLSSRDHQSAVFPFPVISIFIFPIISINLLPSVSSLNNFPFIISQKFSL